MNQLEQLHQLLERTDVLVQQTNAITQSMGPSEGSDSTDQVRVRLDAQGLVADVTVGFAWASALSPEGLAPAVMEAATQAQVARLEQYGTAIERQMDEPEPRARPAADALAPIFHERTAGAPDEADASLALLEELLEDTRTGLEEATQLLEEHERREHVGRSSRGHVRASVTSGGGLLSITIDQAWLRAAHPANLGREITEAVRRAVLRSQKDGLAAAMAASRLARLAELTTGYRTPQPDFTDDEETAP